MERNRLLVVPTVLRDRKTGGGENIVERNIVFPGRRDRTPIPR